ncbi:MAG: glutathione peroxidase [Geminicoccaceae bacterium]
MFARKAYVLAAMIGALWMSMIATAVAAPGSAHHIEFTSIEGQPLPLSAYSGQAVLLVNTASLCGFTYQYAGLQEVWERYRDRGLVVLGVPSNDFGQQEPGSEAEIKTFCEVNFDVDFSMTTKESVKGEEAHPFFQHVAATLGEDSLPHWNFHKYLIAPDGHLVNAWPSKIEPRSLAITDAIEQVLP